MNLKSLPVALALVAAAFSGQALGVLADHISVKHSHFVLGAQAGYASRSGDLNIDITHPAPNNMMSSHVRKHNDTGFLYGFLTGYQWNYDEYLFGLEVSLGFQDFGKEQKFVYQDAQTPRNSYSGSAKFTRDLVIGLSGRFGFHLAPWITTYMRLGAQTSQEKISFYSSRDAAPIGVSMEHGRRAVRFLGGLGLEFPSVYNTVVRLEYNLSTRSKGASYTTLASDGLTTFSANIKPIQHALYLGFVWNFNPEAFIQSSA